MIVRPDERHRAEEDAHGAAEAGAGAPAVKRPKISIVTALFKSAPYIKEFHARHVRCLKEMGVDFEFIFVDDGSPDDSEAVVRELMRSHPQITLVSLSRNCGQHAAMQAGLAHATGDYVCALDVDLEEEPENIVGMFEWFRKAPEIDVVYGVVERRSAGFLRDWASSAFYIVLNSMSRLNLAADQAWQRVMTRQYVEALLQYQESTSLYAGLMQLAGFNQQPYLIQKQYKGSSSYSMFRRIALALDSIISFTSAPLLVISCMGIAVTAVSFACIAVLIVARLAGYEFQSGWPSVIASVWCVGGLILLSVGVVGVYLARVFEQVKGRPRYIVRRLLRSQAAPE